MKFNVLIVDHKHSNHWKSEAMERFWRLMDVLKEQDLNAIGKVLNDLHGKVNYGIVILIKLY